jgi:hypothetical protein
MKQINLMTEAVLTMAKKLPREPEVLPQWPNGARGAPAAVLRSALFGMVKRGKRRALHSEVVACWKGDEIKYTGWQLDQADCDCWLQILHLAKEQALGEDVHFTGREFLRGMGRDQTGNTHKWLRGSINRLQACGVNIRLAAGISYQGPLVHKFIQDENTGHYVIRVNLDIAQLFDDAFVRINYERRKLLRTDLSKWLQGYIQSHQATDKSPHRIGLVRLQALSGSKVNATWKFKQQVKAALEQLVEVGAVKRFGFPPKGSIVEWVRTEQKNSSVG